MKKRIHKVCFLLGCFLTCIGCYEPVNGCLNPEAENYSALADEQCDDCCEFPDLSLRFIPLFEDTTFVQDDTIFDAFGNQFKLDQFEFFLENVRLVSSDGETKILDSLSYLDASGSVERLNDIIVFSFGKTSYNVGNFNAVKTFTAIRFDVGLNIMGLDFESLPTGNPLIALEDSLYIDDAFYSSQLDILTGTSFNDTMTVSCSWPIIALELEFEEPVTSLIGQDLAVTIPFEMSKWIMGINVILDTPEEICAKLQSNVSLAFGL